MDVVLLDTNHLSNLATSDASAAPVLQILQSGAAVLGVTTFTLLELAHPNFKGWENVRDVLRDVPHVLANPFDDVIEEEIAVAVARAGGLTRRPPRVWAKDTSQWGTHLGPVGGTAADMLLAFRDISNLRQEMLTLVENGARESVRLKEKAALIREPMLPLTLAIRRHLEEMRSTLPTYAGSFTAAEIISRNGGKDAFPAFRTEEALVEQRLKDPGQKSTGNDLLDEYFALYSPYAAVTAVDRRTLHRARMAKLPVVARMTYKLEEVKDLLRRVQDGSLQVQPFAV